jgi:hypothetical protein
VTPVQFCHFHANGSPEDFRGRIDKRLVGEPGGGCDGIGLAKLRAAAAGSKSSSLGSSFMAAMNKSLAQSNKSRKTREATKKPSPALQVTAKPAESRADRAYRVTAAQGIQFWQPRTNVWRIVTNPQRGQRD